MENTIYIGLSRLSALQEHMNIISNNIANINTPGYKANKILFSEYMDKPKGMKETLSMVLDYGNYRVQDNGPLKTTGNPLDIALEGQGYFGVQGPDGKTAFTRNGSFTISADRQLITQQGYPVLDAGGQAISIPEGQNDIVIDQQGNIAANQGSIGTLMVQEFKNIQSLKPFGNSLYKTDEAGTASSSTRVIQGSIEGSNTQGVIEMTDMIDVSRTYQSVARMLQTEHDRIRSTIKTMTQGS
jgi:flagellar basal-body rod protein FlgF